MFLLVYQELSEASIMPWWEVVQQFCSLFCGDSSYFFPSLTWFFDKTISDHSTTSHYKNWFQVWLPCNNLYNSSTKEVIVSNPSKFLFATENLSSKEKLAPEALSSYWTKEVTILLKLLRPHQTLALIRLVNNMNDVVGIIYVHLVIDFPVSCWIG